VENHNKPRNKEQSMLVLEKSHIP